MQPLKEGTVKVKEAGQPKGGPPMLPLCLGQSPLRHWCQCTYLLPGTKATVYKEGNLHRLRMDTASETLVSGIWIQLHAPQAPAK